MTCDIQDPEETESSKRIVDLPEGVPPLRSFYLYMTSGCNLRCSHCWINPSYEKGKPSPGSYIELGLLKDAVEVGKTIGLSQVKMTGGEPFLHPEFLEIVDYFAAQSLPVNIETNGTLITKETAIHLKQNSSVWHLSVSIDSPRSSYHDKFRGVRGAFDNTVKGLRNLVEAGFAPQVIMSPHKGNAHEVRQLVELAVDLGAGSVKFNPVMGSGRGATIHEKGEALTFDETLELVHYINVDLQDDFSIPLIAVLPPALLSLKELLTPIKAGGRCGVLNILGILGSGELALCGIGRTVHDLCFGALGESDLKDVWFNHPTLKSIRTGFAERFPGVCGDCIHSSRCLMNCVAHNYVVNGKLISPDPMCLEADARNSFPDSRRRSYSPFVTVDAKN